MPCQTAWGGAKRRRAGRKQTLLLCAKQLIHARSEEGSRDEIPCGVRGRAPGGVWGGSPNVALTRKQTLLLCAEQLIHARSEEGSRDEIPCGVRGRAPGGVWGGSPNVAPYAWRADSTGFCGYNPSGNASLPDYFFWALRDGGLTPMPLLGALPQTPQGTVSPGNSHSRAVNSAPCSSRSSASLFRPPGALGFGPLAPSSLRAIDRCCAVLPPRGHSNVNFVSLGRLRLTFDPQ